MKKTSRIGTRVPLYEYQCKKCKHRFEKIQTYSEAPVKKCPKCGAAVEKLISAPAVQFKGSGWYVNDYPKKSSGESKRDSGADGPANESAGKNEDKTTPAASEGGGGGKSSDGKGSEGKGGESKAASKTEAKPKAPTGKKSHKQ